MPRQPPSDRPRHQVLGGQRSDSFHLWSQDFERATRATGCFELFFPDAANPDWDEEDFLARQSEGTWQSLAWRMKTQTAARILDAFISGPMWAYLLTRWPNDEMLLHNLGRVVGMAEEASLRFSAAPATERERNRMLYELENGTPDEYPSLHHFQEAKEWLEVAVHLSTSKEAVETRRRARNGLSPLRLKGEAVREQLLAEIPNNAARRRQRDNAEDAPEGPQRRRLKLEP